MNFNPLELVKQMGEFQEKLSSITAEGSSGGGMVVIELNGKFEVISVRIAPEAVEDGDTGMLQDLVQASFSDALQKIQEAIGRTIPGGFNLSGLGNLMGNA